MNDNGNTDKCQEPKEGRSYKLYGHLSITRFVAKIGIERYVDSLLFEVLINRISRKPFFDNRKIVPAYYRYKTIYGRDSK